MLCEKTAVPQADALLAGQIFSSKLPRHRSVVVGEGTRRTVGTDQSHLYCLLCSLLDRLIAMRTLLLTDIASDALSTHLVPGTLQTVWRETYASARFMPLIRVIGSSP